MPQRDQKNGDSVFRQHAAEASGASRLALSTNVIR